MVIHQCSDNSGLENVKLPLPLCMKDSRGETNALAVDPALRCTQLPLCMKDSRGETNALAVDAALRCTQLPLCMKDSRGETNALAVDPALRCTQQVPAQAAGLRVLGHPDVSQD